MNKRYTFKDIYQYFKDNGCELLENKYINYETKMKYKCECGTVSEISFNHFKQGQRCIECKKRKIGDKKRFSLEYVQQYFKKYNCELLEKIYRNGSTLMEYKCSCGNISKIRFENFKQGCRCSESGGNKKLTFEYIQECFKKQGCELLETEYKNNKRKLKYRCNCGNISKIRLIHFTDGHRCKKCSLEKSEQTQRKNHNGKLFYQTDDYSKRFGKGYSRESQKLFDFIYKNFDTKYKKKTYFATLNKEFSIKYKNRGFKYDFVNSQIKKCIEYNGTKFHPQPHQKDDETGWFIFDKTKTVKEARDYEKIKYEGIEKRGYKILTVWDIELRKDFASLAKKCLNFLLN